MGCWPAIPSTAAAASQLQRLSLHPNDTWARPLPPALPHPPTPNPTPTHLTPPHPHPAPCPHPLHPLQPPQRTQYCELFLTDGLQPLRYPSSDYLGLYLAMEHIGQARSPGLGLLSMQ